MTPLRKYAVFAVSAALIAAGVLALAMLYERPAQAETPAVTLSGLPEEHGGSNFTFTLTYNDTPVSQWRKVRDEEVSVTGGAVQGVKRAHTSPADRNYVWAVTVAPTVLSDVTIDVRGVTATVPVNAPVVEVRQPPTPPLEVAKSEVSKVEVTVATPVPTREPRTSQQTTPLTIERITGMTSDTITLLPGTFSGTKSLPRATGGTPRIVDYVPTYTYIYPSRNGLTFDRNTHRVTATRGGVHENLRLTVRDSAGDTATWTFTVDAGPVRGWNADVTIRLFGGDASPSCTYSSGATDSEGAADNLDCTEYPRFYGVVGEAFELELPRASGGTAPYSYTMIQALPAGLAVDGASREISGTPTAATTGRNYDVSVSDRHGFNNHAHFWLGVSETALRFATAPEANYAMTLNTAGTVTLPAPQGGFGGYTIGLRPDDGNNTALLAGLSNDPPNRRISGTPTRAGITRWLYTVTDAEGQVLTHRFTITVS